MEVGTKNHTTEKITGPDSRIVVYVDTLGEVAFARTGVFTWRFWRVEEELGLVIPPKVGRIMAPDPYKQDKQGYDSTYLGGRCR